MLKVINSVDKKENSAGLEVRGIIRSGAGAGGGSRFSGVCLCCLAACDSVAALSRSAARRGFNWSEGALPAVQEVGGVIGLVPTGRSQGDLGPYLSARFLWTWAVFRLLGFSMRRVSLCLHFGMAFPSAPSQECPLCVPHTSFPFLLYGHQ